MCNTNSQMDRLDPGWDPIATFGVKKNVFFLLRLIFPGFFFAFLCWPAQVLPASKQITDASIFIVGAGKVFYFYRLSRNIQTVGNTGSSVHNSKASWQWRRSLTAGVYCYFGLFPLVAIITAAFPVFILYKWSVGPNSSAATPVQQ